MKHGVENIHNVLDQLSRKTVQPMFRLKLKPMIEMIVLTQKCFKMKFNKIFNRCRRNGTQIQINNNIKKNEIKFK